MSNELKYRALLVEIVDLLSKRDMPGERALLGLSNRIEAALAEPPVQAEPVAWRCRQVGSDHWVLFTNKQCRFCEPLYANPVAQLKAKAAVPDGMILVDKRSLGTVLQALVNAPHHIRELQATREPAALFKDNPINVLIANYEAAPTQPQNREEPTNDA